MTIQTIPIVAVPSQSFTINLNGQSCAINIYQLKTGLYFDLFVDTKGTSDPTYDELGTRYQLVYES